MEKDTIKNIEKETCIDINKINKDIEYINDMISKKQIDYPGYVAVWKGFIELKKRNYEKSVEQCKKAFENLENCENIINEISNKENISKEEMLSRVLNMCLVVSNNSI